jgi:hypothetical protein
MDQSRPIAAAAGLLDVVSQKSTLNNSSTTVQTVEFERVDSVLGDEAQVENGKAAIAAGQDSNVRVLQLHEWKEAAASLAEAFAEDHSSMYFLDTPDRAHWTKQQKWALHVRIMEYITYAHLLKGLVVSAGPSYDCVALWYVRALKPY